jgi:hypothetical protein
MPRVDRSPVFLIALFCLFFGGCGKEDLQVPEKEAAETISSPWLPGADDVAGWEPAGNAALFSGRDLFVYINGGAEIYHEYGFEKVVVQDYRSAEGSRINLEIFEMECDRGAFGIYSFKRGRGGDSLPLGNGGVLKDYYINFWKGRAAVTVTGLDSSQETLSGLRAVALAVDARLPAGGVRPGLVAFPGMEGLIGNSERYMMGGLSLYNTEPFFARNVFFCDEAAKGDFVRGRTGFLLRYARVAEAAGRFEAVEKTFRSDPGISASVLEEDTFSLRDRKGRLIVVRQEGPYMAVVIADTASGESPSGAGTPATDSITLVREILRGVGGNVDSE